MKIAVVAPTHIPARRANTMQVMKMTQALAELGHNVRLASPGLPAGGEACNWEDLASYYGLRSAFGIDWLPANPSLRRYDFGYHAMRWARGWDAEMLYTRLPQAAAIASPLGMATILEVHDLPRGTFGPLLLRRFLKGRGARRLVAITHALANDLGRFGLPNESTFTVIAPDGVDLERYAHLPPVEEARRRLELRRAAVPGVVSISLPAGRFTAGYSGHLYPGRGADMLLAIARRLPEITFLLVGGEPEDVARLQNEVQAEGLKNLILAGFVPNAELACYQAACDVLLMPYQRHVAASSGGDISRYLSPMKLFEYLACGRTILSSDLPVLREILSSENAVLLPPEEVDAWVEALQSLQAEPEHMARLADRARQDASRYTWEARARKILSDLPGL